MDLLGRLATSMIALAGTANLTETVVLLVAPQHRPRGQGKVTMAPADYEWPYTIAATPAPVA